MNYFLHHVGEKMQEGGSVHGAPWGLLQCERQDMFLLFYNTHYISQNNCLTRDNACINYLQTHFYSSYFFTEINLNYYLKIHLQYNAKSYVTDSLQTILTNEVLIRHKTACHYYDFEGSIPDAISQVLDCILWPM